MITWHQRARKLILRVKNLYHYPSFPLFSFCWKVQLTFPKCWPSLHLLFRRQLWSKHLTFTGPWVWLGNEAACEAWTCIWQAICSCPDGLFRCATRKTRSSPNWCLLFFFFFNKWVSKETKPWLHLLCWPCPVLHTPVQAASWTRSPQLHRLHTDIQMDIFLD